MTATRTETFGEGLLQVTLDRPDSANAIDATMALELADLGRRCEADASIRAVVLTGSGTRFFCAGGDIGSFVSAGDALAPMLRELTMHLHAALSSFARMNAVLITAINGAAAGGGLGLAIAGDLCIAARSASFKSAYTAIGLSPDASTSFWLPKLVGVRRAQQMVLTNVTVDSARALEWGLVTEVVEDAQLVSRARALAVGIGALPGPSVAASRRLLLESMEGASLTEQLDREGRSISQLALTPEARTQIDRFLSKSKKG
ncbi:MAG: enoyl-CoA hydratase-related protein [Polyangia bacterium]